MKTRSRSLSVSFINRNEQIIPLSKLDYYSPPISLVDGVNFRSKSVIMCRLLFQCKAMVAVRLFCLPLYLSGVRLATPIWWMASIHQLRRLISAKEKKTHRNKAKSLHLIIHTDWCNRWCYVFDVVASRCMLLLVFLCSPLLYHTKSSKIEQVNRGELAKQTGWINSSGAPQTWIARNDRYGQD